jgi:ATP-dependent DNA helicase RecQ
LVLAGPGSGKTRVIVHRIAYLVRVRRVAPQRIIALAFNRSAAVELRRRLGALVGAEARWVTVLTYHAMALRLTGTSLAAADRSDAPVDFDALLDAAINLLTGKVGAITDADEARDRLLQGYQYIFVDEYQDIDERQYALVRALAGRTQADPDSKLSVMAVGDDDQNIYSFKGSNVEFIRRFQADYGGQVTYLVENFRSTQHIISPANHVIQRALDRMKVDHPIRVDAKRASDPPGGRWSGIDPDQGKVRLITAPGDANRQAQLIYEEIKRIRAADPSTSLGGIAVLARTHEALVPLRALCELEGVRHEITTPDARDARVGLMSTREGRRVADLLARSRSRLRSVHALFRWLGRQGRAQPGNPFWDDLRLAAKEFAEEAAAKRVPGAELLDALYEAADETRRGHQPAALKLMTVHAAKGQEFDHVLIMDCGDWWRSAEDERRLLYVAMTRARQTLTLMRDEGGRNPYLVDLGTVSGVFDRLPGVRPHHRPEIEVSYLMLGPKQVDLGFAGRRGPKDPIHADLARLCAGDTVVIDGGAIKSASGRVVGKLSRSTAQEVNKLLPAKVTAIMARRREQTTAPYFAAVRCDRWEVVLAEVVRIRERPDGVPDGCG